MFTDYLLGRLSAEDRDRVEREYLADDSLHQEIIAVESELLDSYVRGELSVDEQKYLVGNLGPAVTERIQFARALGRVMGTLKSERLVAHRIRPRWTTVFSIPLRVQVAAACLGMVLFAVVALNRWPASSPRVPVPDPPLVAPIERRVPTIDAVLFPVERSVGQQESVTLPHDARIITLQLVVSSHDYPGYVAKLDALDGSWSRTLTGLHLSQNAAGERVAEFQIDSTQVKPGDYRIALSGVRGSTEDLVAGYVFRAKTE